MISRVCVNCVAVTAPYCPVAFVSVPRAIGVVVCRVHGVSGLRVADASVAPHIPSTPIQAMAMMIGDRAASLALKDRFAKDQVQARANVFDSKRQAILRRRFFLSLPKEER